MRELVAAADYERVKCIPRVELRCPVPIESGLRSMRRSDDVCRESTIVTHRRGGGIIFRSDELYLLKFAAQIVQRFLYKIRVLVTHMAEFCRGHTHEKDWTTGVAIAGGLQPGVIRMAVDLFFQRIQNAQPRIGRKAWAWNRHKIKFRGAAARFSARYQNASRMLSFPAEQPRFGGRLRWVEKISVSWNSPEY